MDFSKLNGLVPAVIQDDGTNEVLMVGFMNDAALARTRDDRLRDVLLANAIVALDERRDVRQPAARARDPHRLR